MRCRRVASRRLTSGGLPPARSDHGPYSACRATSRSCAVPLQAG